ncbi:formate dehydrogenase accessory protein FdhE [Pararobbsia silviterrae]|uniref:Protein FdhE homolog n=1 Tax=Pararobbsia silviterrae TaxID=1792498 RepID=A0A494X793_9BURK|nr:formate dehydrogenase accessory protein FdhE [Pararobbsia silviterrae]RKP46577.1 formate dehydrogenase accessory protein FdhE [Pararobbsia silviterrae]
MPRILEPGEIATLDASALPRIRLPARATIFSARAQRLRALAHESAIGGYLRLMASVADAQHTVLGALPPASIDRAALALALAQRNGMPVRPAAGATLDPAWRDILRALSVCLRDALRADVSRDIPHDVSHNVSHDISRDTSAADGTHAVETILARLDAMTPDDLDRLAAAVLEHDLARVDIALAPFIHAALEIAWTQYACALDTSELPYLDTPGLCPTCGSPPVASIVRIGGAHDGYRYLQCGLCATEFHLVRVKCAYCDSTKGIAYYSVDENDDSATPRAVDAGARPAAPGRVPGTRAESCDACRHYVKIFAQATLLDAEPFADDLASIGLDLLMNEAGYTRAYPHPFLWPAASDVPDVSDASGARNAPNEPDVPDT